MGFGSGYWVFFSIALVVAISGGLAMAMEPFSTWPPSQVFLTASWCMIVQWVVFIHAAIYNTEKCTPSAARHRHAGSLPCDYSPYSRKPLPLTVRPSALVQTST